MNEVKTIHLGRQQYTIAVDAHRELRAYLDEISHQIGANSEDVLKEVELRMVELLSEHGVGPHKVVLADDIAFLKEQLGDPRNFKDDDEAHDEPKNKESATPGEKKLYRDTEHGIVAGVAAGLASYLNIDVLVIRIIFGASVFLSGAGIIAYVLLWILAPEAKTSSDKLKMRGKAVTVDSIKQAVNRADISGAATRASKTAGSFIERLMIVIVMILGIAVIGVAIASLIATIIGSVFILAHGVVAGSTVLFPTTAEHYVLYGSAILTALILELLLLIGGLAMVRRKSVVKGWVLAGFVVVFFISSSLAGTLAAKSFPDISRKYHGLYQTQNYELQPFTTATLIGGDVQFSYQQDSSYFIEVRTFADMEKGKDIKREVVDGRLTVDTSAYNKARSCSGLCLFEINNLEVTEVVVHAPAVSAIKILAAEGENYFSISKPLTSPELTVDTEGIVHTWLTQLTFDKVTLALADSHTKRITLTNVSKGENTSTLSVDGGVHLYKANAVDVVLGDRTCEEVGSILSLNQVGSFVLNGEKLSKQDIAAKQAEHNNLYNCVQVN